MAGAARGGSGSSIEPVATLAAAVIAAVLIVAGGQRLFGVLGTTALASLSPALQEGLFTFLLFGLLLAVALVAMRRGRSGLAGRRPAAMAGAGASIGLSALLIATMLAAATGGLGSGAGAGRGVFALLLGTVVILFQASVEEVYFRGWLQPVLVRRWGPAAGLVAAAAAFATLHIAGGARTPLTLVNLFLGGLLFGLLALRSGGLAAPAAAHAAYNWAEQILLGLDPNPGTGSYGALTDLDLTGAAAWGGSAEGLNASLAVSFVLVALILPIAAWPGRAGRLATAPGSPG